MTFFIKWNDTQAVHQQAIRRHGMRGLPHYWWGPSSATICTNNILTYQLYATQRPFRRYSTTLTTLKTIFTKLHVRLLLLSLEVPSHSELPILILIEVIH